MSAGRVVLVAGMGDVGSRMALLRAARGEDVMGLRRRDVAAPKGVRLLRTDLASGEGLSRLPRRVDALVFCAAPDRRDEPAYRALYVDGLRRLMDACDAARVVFVSSTAVYGEDAGEWVDEATPARPPAFNGRVLLDAERVLSDWPEGVVLRLSGIYGPGRESMLRKARAGDAGAPRWTNRIHVDDAASALSHLLDLPHPQPVYLGNDDEPSLEHEVLDWVRAREGLPPVATATGPGSGRRVRNARLRASGWAPRYPDYRSGYAGLLDGAGV
ncbi:NAD-dependent epimerase/dehydratase family protein [Arenimonas sp.]|uniref:NAD-dependent epimerase/dehydratase family protein n=1 Tax=Arenimonas sp. TaxID=1872635 RepID=UPI0025C1F159|nr:NAD-dependent epimerase/dehydratase family protein [Arenimonas sp.]